MLSTWQCLLISGLGDVRMTCVRRGTDANRAKPERASADTDACNIWSAAMPALPCVGHDLVGGPRRHAPVGLGRSRAGAVRKALVVGPGSDDAAVRVWRDKPRSSARGFAPEPPRRTTSKKQVCTSSLSLSSFLFFFFPRQEGSTTTVAPCRPDAQPLKKATASQPRPGRPVVLSPSPLSLPYVHSLSQARHAQYVLLHSGGDTMFVLS